MSELSAKITDFWSVFKYYLFVNSTEEPTYLLTRQHVGSLAAFAIAGYNTFLLRQKIIKNAIHLTKSNNPKIVIGTSFFVAAFYYVGLTIVWHIPSFFSELAVRVYCSAQNATTTVLFREELKNEIFSEERINFILKKYS